MRYLTGIFLGLVMILSSSNSFASATRTIHADSILSTDESKSLTFSGAASVSGTNTGDVTIGTANGLSITGLALSMALANGTVTGTLSAADYNTFNGKLSSTLTSAFIFVGNGSNVATGVAVSGDLTTTNAGVFTIGAKKVQASKLDSGAAANGTIATADGAGGVSYLAPASDLNTFNVSGTAASPNLLAAAGNITFFSSTNYLNLAFISGNAGAVSGITFGTCPLAGFVLQLHGGSDTNTVSIADSANAVLNGPIIMKNRTMMTLSCESTGGPWIELSRSN